MRSCIFAIVLLIPSCCLGAGFFGFSRGGIRGRRSTVRRSYSSNSHRHVSFSGSYQQKAQQEANYMAQRNIRGHVGGTIGRFEGVGYGRNGSVPSTCSPRSGRLVADALAKSKYGVFRVRAWR